MNEPHHLVSSQAKRDFIAGGVAGALSIAITQPLDTVRVNLQNNSTPSTTPSPAAAGAAPSAGSSDGRLFLRRGLGGSAIMREFGHQVAWDVDALAFASLQNAILFQSCGAVLRQQDQSSRLRDDNGRSIPTLAQATGAGCLAGLAQVFLWSPVELVKIRLQTCMKPGPSVQVKAFGRAAFTGSPVHPGSLSMLRHILKHEGLRGLYRGFTVSALRDVPSYGVYFGTYYHCSHLLEHWKRGAHVHPEDAPASTQILAGGMAGVLGWSSVYYLDVIKSRMQVKTAQETAGKTWLHFGKQVYQEHGLRGFVRGLQPTLVRAFLMDAVAFWGFSSTLHLLDGL